MKFLKGTLFYLADHLLLVGFLACTIAGWIGPAIGFLIAAFYFKLDDICVQLKKVRTTTNINVESVTLAGHKEE